MSDSEYATRSKKTSTTKKQSTGATVKGKNGRPTDQHDHNERGVQPGDDQFPKVPPLETKLPVRAVAFEDDNLTDAGEHWLVRVTAGGEQGVKPTMELDIPGIGRFELRRIDANHSSAAVGGVTRQAIAEKQGQMSIQPSRHAAPTKRKK